MDNTLFPLINEQWTHPALDLFMAAISHFGIWRPFAIGLILIVLIFGGFRARACICCILVCLLVAGTAGKIGLGWTFICCPT